MDCLTQPGRVNRSGSSYTAKMPKRKTLSLSLTQKQSSENVPLPSGVTPYQKTTTPEPVTTLSQKKMSKALSSEPGDLNAAMNHHIPLDSSQLNTEIKNESFSNTCLPYWLRKEQEKSSLPTHVDTASLLTVGCKSDSIPTNLQLSMEIRADSRLMEKSYGRTLIQDQDDADQGPSPKKHLMGQQKVLQQEVTGPHFQKPTSQEPHGHQADKEEQHLSEEDVEIEGDEEGVADLDPTHYTEDGLPLNPDMPLRVARAELARLDKIGVLKSFFLFK